jgi:hypothetical protein
MMIQRCKAEIFEWQAAQPLDSACDGHPTGAHIR